MIQEPSGFIRWVDSAPTPYGPEYGRYAIVKQQFGIRWQYLAISYHDRQIVVEESGGGFYDGCEDHPEGAVEWAAAMATKNALRHLFSFELDVALAAIR